MLNRVWMLLIAAVLTFTLASPTLADGAAVKPGEKAVAALDTGALGPAGVALPSGLQAKPDTLGDQIAQGKKKKGKKKNFKKKGAGKKKTGKKKK